MQDRLTRISLFLSAKTLIFAAKNKFNNAVMKNIIIALLFYCPIMSCYAQEGVNNPSSDLSDITIKNFPVIDGSDSTEPLRYILTCKLLGFEYEWQKSPFGGQYPNQRPNYVVPNYTGDKDDIKELRNKRLLNSNTHGSFVNLIDDKVDLIITARSISRDEKVYADENNVTLIEKPIARDALAFMVNIKNPIENLSIEQIQGIYTGDIVNWSEVGGLDCEIHPYVRNRNSGSQEKFETMVMAGLTIASFPEMRVGLTMMAPYYQLDGDSVGVAFTPFYYFTYISGTESAKVIGVNGIAMTKENIKNDTYPYTSHVYAAVRSDIDKSSLAYRMFEFLTTEEGQAIVEESGYVPIYTTPTAINSAEPSREHSQDPTIYDLQGRKMVGGVRKGITIQNGKKTLHR